MRLDWWLVWVGLAAAIYISSSWTVSFEKDVFLFLCGGFSMYNLMEFNKNA